MFTPEELEMHVDYFRKRRTELLKESDWTQLPDAPLNDNDKGKWVEYRQALRDFPSLFTADIEALPELPIAPNIIDVTVT